MLIWKEKYFLAVSHAHNLIHLLLHSFIHPPIHSPINTTVNHCAYFSSRSLSLSAAVCPLSTFTINCWHCRWLSSHFTVSQLMVLVFFTRTALLVQFKSVRLCLNPSHSVSYQKNNNYTFQKTFTIHHPSHMHYQSTDHIEIRKNINIVLYHLPLMNVMYAK